MGRPHTVPCGCSRLIGISRRWGWARHLPVGWPGLPGECADSCFVEGINWDRMVTFFLFGVALHTELAAIAHVDSLSSRRSDEMENKLHPWIIANGGWFPPSFTGELFSLLLVLYCSWGEANEAVLHMGFTWLKLGRRRLLS
uniref:Bcl-2 Bcl-2 homology region 1-3 domain-containing protein n=1 Tax=Eptatretus burgeri TaxID=7764 RepID=A0A8C4NG87_EPTBU